MPLKIKTIQNSTNMYIHRKKEIAAPGDSSTYLQVSLLSQVKPEDIFGECDSKHCHKFDKRWLHRGFFSC